MQRNLICMDGWAEWKCKIGQTKLIHSIFFLQLPFCSMLKVMLRANPLEEVILKKKFHSEHFLRQFGWISNWFCVLSRSKRNKPQSSTALSQVNPLLKVTRKCQNVRRALDGSVRTAFHHLATVWLQVQLCYSAAVSAVQLCYSAALPQCNCATVQLCYSAAMLRCSSSQSCAVSP